MERFPTEIMVQIASCLPKNDLSRFGTCSSKCATIAQPQLYHTLTLLEKSDSFRRCSQFLMNVASRRHLPSMIRVLSIVGEDAWPELSLAELIRLCDHIEELLLPGSDIGAYPSDSRLFFGMPVSHLRRFRCRRHKAIPDLMKWVTRITTLSDVRLPERSNMKMAAYLGHTIVPPAWLKNLERYWGPPEVLGGLKSDCKLLHLSTHLDMSDSQLRQLASACGDQLQTLHHFSEYGYGWARDPNLPPALLPQLFPNLRSVAWILINPIDREEVRTISEDHSFSSNRLVDGAIRRPRVAAKTRRRSSGRDSPAFKLTLCLAKVPR